MNRIHELSDLIELGAEEDAFIIRFNDLSQRVKNVLSRIIKNGSSIYTVRSKDNISIQRIKDILTANNPIIWSSWNPLRADHYLVCNYPLFRYREQILSRIVYYAMKGTQLTSRQLDRIKYGVETHSDLKLVHLIRTERRQHNRSTCQIYHCPICREEDNIEMAANPGETLNIPPQSQLYEYLFSNDLNNNNEEQPTKPQQKNKRKKTIHKVSKKRKKKIKQNKNNPRRP
jgi:hypothetical protein